MVFRPERWLQSDTTEMDKHLLSFARGSRMCPGIKYVLYFSASHPRSFVFAYLLFRKLSDSIANADNTSLAYAELYLTIAHLFRKFELELYQTTSEDMDWKDVTVPRMKGQLKVIVREAKD